MSIDLKKNDPMKNYDLRSEITAKNHRYFVQTNLVPSQEAIVTSLFHEGTLLSKQVQSFDTSVTSEEARRLVRVHHEEKKSRINSLIEIREKLKQTEDGKAHLKLSEALYHQSLFREAMAEVVRAVKLGMEESKAYSILGNSLVALGEYEKAIKAFRKGLAITPDYPDLHNDVGRAFLGLEKCREAVDAFEKAVDLNKYYQEAFMNLALALCLNVVRKEDFELSRGLKTKLEGILSKNLQLKPSLDSDDFRQAQKAVTAERYDAAYEILSRIHKEEAQVSENHLSLDLYLILKFNSENLGEEEIDRYIESTQRALEANPGYADLQNNLGILYTAKCKLYIDKAQGAFQSSLKINKKFKRAEKNLKLSVNDGQGIHLLLRALLD